MSFPLASLLARNCGKDLGKGEWLFRYEFLTTKQQSFLIDADDQTLGVSMLCLGPGVTCFIVSANFYETVNILRYLFQGL